MRRSARIAGMLLALAIVRTYLAPVPSHLLSARTRPLPADARQARFLVFGDMGRGDAVQAGVAAAMAATCARDGCDFAVTTGDNIYPAGVASADDPRFGSHFERPYAALGELDVWMVLGNHDWKGHLLRGARAQIAYTLRSPRWRMPDIHYRVPGLPEWLHLYALDTSALEGGVGIFQLVPAMAALCGRPGWRLLFGHYPTVSSGADGDGGHWFIRWAIERVIRRCRVQGYLAGHDHHQEHLALTGYDMIIQGAAGGHLSPVHGSDPRQRFAAARTGFAWARATPDSLEFRFFDETGTLLYRFARAARDDASEGALASATDR